MKLFGSLLIGAAICWSSIAGADTAIKIYNKTMTSTVADVHVFQGEYHIAQFSLPQGGNVSVDTTPRYSITATPLTGNVTFPDQPLKLEGKSATVEASVINKNGGRSLQLVSTGSRPQPGLTIINHAKEGIQVVITKGANPFHAVIRLEGNSEKRLEGSSNFSAYAIVNGVKTNKVSAPSPDGYFTITGSESAGFTISGN